MTLSDEDRAVLVAGLDALQRRLRDDVKVRPDRAKHYSPMAARAYYRAEELINRLTLDG